MDLDIVYVNEYYIYSAIVGGVIMGGGFIIGGFCPGTSFTAAAIGKIDAMWFILGSMIGIFIFGETYNIWQELHMSGYKGAVKISDILSIRDGYFALLLIIVASVMFWIAELAEKKFKRDDITKEI
jgi:hypothetical protein